jgi:hypothetical protein
LEGLDEMLENLEEEEENEPRDVRIRSSAGIGWFMPWRRDKSVQGIDYLSNPTCIELIEDDRSTGDHAGPAAVCSSSSSRLVAQAFSISAKSIDTASRCLELATCARDVVDGRESGE